MNKKLFVFALFGIIFFLAASSPAIVKADGVYGYGYNSYPTYPNYPTYPTYPSYPNYPSPQSFRTITQSISVQSSFTCQSVQTSYGGGNCGCYPASSYPSYPSYGTQYGYSSSPYSMSSTGYRYGPYPPYRGGYGGYMPGY